MKTTPTFSYIQTGHKLALAKLSQHEYFGEDFLAGKCTVAIVRTVEGRHLRAVWSYGDWNTYGLDPGDLVVFGHTQTRRHVVAYLVAVVSRDRPVPEAFGEMKAVQWTLK